MTHGESRHTQTVYYLFIYIEIVLHVFLMCKLASIPQTIHLYLSEPITPVKICAVWGQNAFQDSGGTATLASPV